MCFWLLLLLLYLVFDLCFLRFLGFSFSNCVLFFFFICLHSSFIILFFSFLFRFFSALYQVALVLAERGFCCFYIISPERYVLISYFLFSFNQFVSFFSFFYVYFNILVYNYSFLLVFYSHYVFHYKLLWVVSLPRIDGISFNCYIFRLLSLSHTHTHTHSEILLEVKRVVLFRFSRSTSPVASWTIFADQLLHSLFLFHFYASLRNEQKNQHTD